ncbi:MAG: metallophosphatase family protein [Kiritimatiellae bacterium]|nr:metallophosphatase family protein [Kiritimatiellia bacterium]
MKVAVISDIHANLDAMRRVLADASREGVEKIACLGDIAGYGPMPKETVDLAKSRCDLVIAGNHDDAVSGRGSGEAFIDLAADAVKRHRAALGADDIAWLKSLPYSASCAEAMFVHGDATDPQRFLYILDEQGAAANFASVDFKLLFVGHTHEPCIFVTGRSGNVYKTAPQDFTIEAGKRYIVNPGSVGYPRDSGGICRSSYVIYDTEERTVRFRFLPFSVASVMQRGGAGSRRRMKAWLLTLLVLAAAAAGALYAVKRFSAKPETAVVQEPERFSATKELVLDGAGEARANLRLKKGSPPANLQVEFLGKAGERLSVETTTVKQSNTRVWHAPKGSDKAVFSVENVESEKLPVIESFEPQACRQTGS